MVDLQVLSVDLHEMVPSKSGTTPYHQSARVVKRGPETVGQGAAVLASAFVVAVPSQ